MAVILAFLAGCLVAYYFYRREKTGHEVFYQKFTANARNIILADERGHLGLTDVINLFHDKIIDEHLDLLDGPFPYKRCPKCGSKKVQRFILRTDGSVDTEHAPDTPPVAGELFRILCRTCGYRDEAAQIDESG